MRILRPYLKIILLIGITAWLVACGGGGGGGGTTAPAAPTGLTATATSSSSINLNWSDNSSDEVNFVVQRSTTQGAGFVNIDTLVAGTTSYTDNNGLSASTTYYYRVYATNSAGNSGNSNEALATTSPPNITPTANGQSVFTEIDVGLAITLTGNDAEGDMLNFTVTTNPVYGVLSGTAPNLIYTPNSLFEGLDNFMFTASDGITESVPAVVNIQVVGAIHVATTGNDANPGSAASPKLTIQAGITQADINFTTSVVKVAAGTYSFDSNVAGPGDNAIVLVEGVWLFGGYNAADWSDRDPVVHVTVINDTNLDDTGSGAYNNVNRTIHATTGISNATIVDGFTIQGGDGDYTTAILLQFGSPTIRNNIILGGTNATTTGAFERSQGLLLSSSTAIITDNVIHGGNGGHFSRGIENSGSSPTILRNNITGGNAFSQSRGILNTSSSSPLIANNTIQSGLATGSGTAVNGTLSSNPIIINNTIYAQSVGIAMFSSNLDIRNNIVYSLGICILEENNLANPVVMRNNDLYGCNTLYRDDGTTNILDLVTNITTNEGSDTLTSFGNVSVDPVFADFDGVDNDLELILDNDWHLTNSSPTSVTVGGLDLSATITTDKDSTTRTDDGFGAGWSMGAYEK